MLKVTLAIIGAFLAPVLVPAQNQGPTAATTKVSEKVAERGEDTNRQLGLDLLTGSHAINEQLSDEERFDLLTGQIQTANRYDKKLGNQWAHELFELGKQGRVRGPGMVELFAVNSIAGSDPDEALKLLADVDPEAIAPRDDEYPGATIAVHMPQNLFRTIVRDNGKQAMPKINQVAESLGAKGRYPYSAVMTAALETKDADIIENTIRQLLTRYQQRLDSPLVSFDFADMLNSSETHWPKNLVKQAIEAAVNGLEQYPLTDDNKDYETTYRTKDGLTTAHGPLEIGLLRIAWLIKRVDPELWTKILKAHPNLATLPADKFGKGGFSMTLRLSKAESSIPPTPEDIREDLMFGIRRLLPDSPDKAMQAINNIPDAATRGEAFSMAAQLLASANKPEKAAQFAAESENIVAKIKQPEIPFRSACARLQADAINGNSAALPQDLEDLFQLADNILRAAREEKKDTFEIVNGLSEAVATAMKIAPALTASYIEQLYLPKERAQLLTSAAMALAPPLRSMQKRAAVTTDPAEQQTDK